MQGIAGILFFVGALSIVIWYCVLIKRGKIQPVFASWVIFAVASSMSLATYISNGKGNFLNNLVNSADVVVTWAVIIAMLVFQREKTKKFEEFDMYCLYASLVLISIWAISESHMIMNFSFQLLMVIAYFPTIKKLYWAKENPESFLVWGGSEAVSSTAFYNAFMKGDALAMVYSGRSAIMILFILALMFRLHLRERRN